jgi:predicted flap endonuclease-1-like 5' DNA nuclease
MSPITVFAVAFLVLMGVTLLLPSFPPAQLLLEFLNVHLTSLFVLGISIVSLLNGVLNGFLWALVALSFYAAARYARGREPLPPLPEAPQLSTPPLTPNPVDSRTEAILPSIKVSPVTVRKSLWSMAKTKLYRKEQPIETIDGIGPTYGASLRNSGISTVNDLLRACATEHKRKILAVQIGVPYTTLLRWVYRGDLIRVKGVGRKYATLLESAGVNTVSDLSTINPRYLSRMLSALNNEKRLVKRTPPSKTIEIWVKTARTLEPIVQIS